MFDVLKQTGLKGQEVHFIIQSIRAMAAANLIARFESKLDSVGTQMGAKIEALDSKFTWMQWAIGIGLTVITVLIAVFGILSQTG